MIGPVRLQIGALEVATMLRANSRADTARMDSAATVIAVPVDMARTASTPIGQMPNMNATDMTRTAPAQGLIPTANTVGHQAPELVGGAKWL